MRGEKSHHSSHLPQFLHRIWWFSDFSGQGLSKFLSRERKKDAEVQRKCLKVKVAQPVLILHGQLARTHIQTVTCGGPGWMSVPIIHELGGIKATVPSKDNSKEVSKLPNHLKPLDSTQKKIPELFPMWFSHHVLGERGQLGGGIYQRTQFNPQLFASSTHSANWWPPFSQHLWYHHSLPLLLKSTIPSEKRKKSQSSALPVHSCTITGTILGKGEPWLQSLAPNSEGYQTWLLHNPRDALTDQSWTDRQTPEDTSLPSCTHRG